MTVERSPGEHSILAPGHRIAAALVAAMLAAGLAPDGVGDCPDGVGWVYEAECHVSSVPPVRTLEV